MATVAFRNAPNSYVTHGAHKTWTPFAFPASFLPVITPPFSVLPPHIDT